MQALPLAGGVAFSKSLLAILSALCKMELRLSPARIIVRPHLRASSGHSVGVWQSVTPLLVPRSYNRKLRAMKAAKEARKTAAGVTPSAAAIPGTNMYNTER